METLRTAFKGDWLTAESPAFESAAFDGLWNQLRPTRLPQIIARVADDQDVILAVNYARRTGLKVVVRGGGHNWCCPSLRNGGMLIDLSRLTRVLSIDASRRIAVVEPIISNRDLIEALRPHGLAYPSGHCPTVKMSGYLLSGGMAWNHGVWGPGVGSVEAIDMVTADGALVTASREQQSELFWAARGAGPGFFAVALRYHLSLYRLPRAIASSAYYFRMSEVRGIAQWLGPLADRLPPSVELSLFMIAAPPELEEHGSKLCMVTASVFADTPEEAAAAAGPLEECPVMDRCLKRMFVAPTTFEQLFDASGALWPDQLRCKVDAMFSNAALADVIDAVADHFLEAPPKTVLMYAVFTGGSAPETPPDAAFSATGRLYGGPWTQWELDTPEEDARGMAWHDRCVEFLAPLMNAHYVSETDTVGHPEYVRKAYSAENLARLHELRKKYDPAGVFFGYHDGFA